MHIVSLGCLCARTVTFVLRERFCWRFCGRFCERFCERFCVRTNSLSGEVAKTSSDRSHKRLATLRCMLTRICLLSCSLSSLKDREPSKVLENSVGEFLITFLSFATTRRLRRGYQNTTNLRSMILSRIPQ